MFAGGNIRQECLRLENYLERAPSQRCVALLSARVSQRTRALPHACPVLARRQSALLCRRCSGFHRRDFAGKARPGEALALQQGWHCCVRLTEVQRVCKIQHVVARIAWGQWRKSPTPLDQLQKRSVVE